MKRLEKARAEWTRFTEEDQPAFARWMSAAFGPLLTESRALKEKLRQKLLLIEELEIEHALRGGSRYSAYYAVTHRSDSPSSTETPWGDSADPEEFPEEPELTEPEKEALFNAFVRSTFGISPGALPREDRETLRAEFDKAMFEEDREEAPPHRAPRHPRDGGPLGARIKEKYRWLARQLHPDTRADKRPDLVAIWHEVQKAYLERDLDRLETLVALVEMREGLLGEQTSLFQARAALREMKAALRALTRSLKEARREPMWRFSLANAEERETVRVRVGLEIRGGISGMTLELAEVEKALERWSTRPAERRRKPREATSREASWGRRQDQFQF